MAQKRRKRIKQEQLAQLGKKTLLKLITFKIQSKKTHSRHQINHKVSKEPEKLRKNLLSHQSKKLLLNYSEWVLLKNQQKNQFKKNSHLKRNKILQLYITEKLARRQIMQLIRCTKTRNSNNSPRKLSKMVQAWQFKNSLELVRIREIQLAKLQPGYLGRKLLRII